MRSVQRLTLTGLTVLLILSQQFDFHEVKMGLWDSASTQIAQDQSIKRHYTQTSNLSPLTQRVKQLKTLVLLISFQDQAIQTKPAEWQQLVFSKDGESVRHYYQTMSQGHFDVSPINEQYENENDGIVAVTIGMKHPNNGTELTRANYQAVWEALNKSAPSLDLGSIDTNHDKLITSNELLIVAVFAGYEDLYKKNGEKSSSGFSHYLYEDNKVKQYTFTEFVQIGELYYDPYMSPKTSITSYGIIAHEIGHVIGLPDLYDTDYSSYGVGFFSLMGNGDKLYSGKGKLGNSPASLDPWCKIFLGFSKETLISSDGIYEVTSSLDKNPTVLRINTQREGEYFLIENRLLEGQDAGLAGFSTRGGILVWHIDESIISAQFDSNTVNDIETHKGIDIVEASEALYGYSQLDTMNASHRLAPFFTTSNKVTLGGVGSLAVKVNLYDGTTMPFILKVVQDGNTAKIQIDFQK